MVLTADGLSLSRRDANSPEPITTFTDSRMPTIELIDLELPQEVSSPEHFPGVAHPIASKYKKYPYTRNSVPRK